MANDNGLSIGWEPVGNMGKAALTVRLAEQVLVAERVDLLDPEKRRSLPSGSAPITAALTQRT